MIGPVLTKSWNKNSTKAELKGGGGGKRSLKSLGKAERQKRGKCLPRVFLMSWRLLALSALRPPGLVLHSLPYLSFCFYKIQILPYFFVSQRNENSHTIPHCLCFNTYMIPLCLCWALLTHTTYPLSLLYSFPQNTHDHLNIIHEFYYLLIWLLSI